MRINFYLLGPVENKIFLNIKIPEVQCVFTHTETRGLFQECEIVVFHLHRFLRQGACAFIDLGEIGYCDCLSSVCKVTQIFPAPIQITTNIPTITKCKGDICLGTNWIQSPMTDVVR